MRDPNLPDGCTARDVDRAAGSDDEPDEDDDGSPTTMYYTVEITARNHEVARDELMGALEDARDSGLIEDCALVDIGDTLAGAEDDDHDEPTTDQTKGQQ